jgi:hypothetical protein
MGWMKAQSEPAGQQMTDCTSALFKDMQVLSLGQQKSDGKLLPHCCRPCTPPQVCACRRKRFDVWIDVTVDASRQKTDILDNLEKVEDLIVVNYNNEVKRSRMPDSKTRRRQDEDGEDEDNEDEKHQTRNNGHQVRYLPPVHVRVAGSRKHARATSGLLHHALWHAQGQPFRGPMLPE